MKYVQMDESHVEQIARLETECFSDPWSLRSITSELNNPLSLWYVAVEGDEVAGYIGSQSVLDEADMMNLAVSESFRRQKIGEKLYSMSLLSQVLCITHLPQLASIADHHFLIEKISEVCIEAYKNMKPASFANARPPSNVSTKWYLAVGTPDFA